jgi:hypothetical protein
MWKHHISTAVARISFHVDHLCACSSDVLKCAVGLAADKGPTTCLKNHDVFIFFIFSLVLKKFFLCGCCKVGDTSRDLGCGVDLGAEMRASKPHGSWSWCNEVQTCHFEQSTLIIAIISGGDCATRLSRDQ